MPLVFLLFRLLPRSVRFAILSSIVLAIGMAAQSHGQTLAIGAELHGDPRLSDGDSFRLGTLRVRLLGIDAPEMNQTCKQNGAILPCGQMARDVLADLIEGEPVACRVVDIDPYDRAVAECFGVVGSLNAAMAAEGWAVAMPRYSERFIGDAKAARAAGMGLWGMEFHDPADWRKGARW